MKELISRWKDDPVFVDVLKNAVLGQGLPQGMNPREWYERLAPRINTYLPECAIRYLDCRYIDLSNIYSKDIYLSVILDHGKVTDSIFIEIGFQFGTGKETDFSRSHFIKAQMSPYYATGANFESCVFIRSFLYGATAVLNQNPNSDELFSQAPTDLTKCRFVRVIGDKSDFARCDFRGADFTEAYFEDCRFDESDLRGVKFESTRFVKCNFANAWLSDTPENRALVARGENKNIEQIHWKPVNS